MKIENGVLYEVTEKDLELLKNNPEKFWEGVRDIGYFAFKNLKGLKKLVIPSTVSQVYDVAVANCPNLKYVIISKGVKKIYNTAFNGNGNLESIIVEEGNENYHSFGNCLVETKTKTLLLGCKNSIIPTDGSVTKIGKDFEWDSSDCLCGFYKTNGIKRLELPKGITSIGYAAFSYNKDLTSIVIPGTVKKIGEFAFAHDDKLKRIQYGDIILKRKWNKTWECNIEGKKITIYFNVDKGYFYNNLNSIISYLQTKQTETKTIKPEENPSRVCVKPGDNQEKDPTKNGRKSVALAAAVTFKKEKPLRELEQEPTK